MLPSLNPGNRIKLMFSDDRITLVTLVLIYTVVFSFFSYLRFVNFFTTNWDLGINEQMLWTSTHGYLLFETGDYIFYHGTVHSFLQIHSTYIALPVSLLYHLVPYSTTLFVIQSLTFSLSIIPLFLIGKDREINRNLLYAISICYLLSFGAISAIFYDYHWESFIPLEFFTMFYFFSHKKYLYSVLSIIVGSLTLEVFPFLAASIVVYFMWTYFRFHMFAIHKMYKRKEWLTPFLILCITGLTYIAIRLLQYFVIPAIVSVHISSSGGALGTSISQLFVPQFHSTLVLTLSYWLLIYASFGFVPLLRPRHLIMQIPWAYSTIFLNNGLASYFGNQYAFIAIPPAIIGLIYFVEPSSNGSQTQERSNISPLTLLPLAILTVSSVFLSRELLSPRGALGNVMVLMFLGSIAAVVISSYLLLNRMPRPQFKTHILRVVVRLRSPVYMALVFIITFNMLMSPLNIENANAVTMPGYSFSYSVNPAHMYMSKIVSYIRSGSTVLASDNLFPYVANNPDAYSVPWFKVNSNIYYPFNTSVLPNYVLVDSSQVFFLPDYMIAAIFNISNYGLRVVAYDQSYPGSIYLFQLGYRNNTLSMFVTPPSSTYYFYGNRLNTGKSGIVATDNSSRFGTVINSRSADAAGHNDNNIWYGPYYTFPAGLYRISISLEGSLLNTSTGGRLPILYMNSNGIGSSRFYSAYVYASQLSKTHWTTISFVANMTEPFPHTEFRGYLIYAGGAPIGNVTLNYIQVETIHLS